MTTKVRIADETIKIRTTRLSDVMVSLIMETVERKYLGIAGSVNSLARNMAFVLGTSLATLILFTAMSNQLGYKVTTYLTNQPDVFLHGFHVAFYFSTFLVLVTWVLGLVRLLGRKKS